MDPKLLLLILMLGGALVLLALAFSGPAVGKVQARRLAAVMGRHSSAAENQIEARMRKAISTSAQTQNNALASLIPDPEKLTKRLRMTGKKWTLNQYMLACAGITVAVAGFGLLRGWAPLTALFVGTAAGLGLPHKYVSMIIAKRIKKFTQNFPDALELMVRGLRSGLPIAETLSVVSTEVPGPVGEEFRLVNERIKIGKTMDQALVETAERLGTPEFQFFCITLTIQRETGGNLAETLANLATVLRQRAQMKLKINAMSSESKASAWIIGSLPFIVFGLISWINFHYMSPFYTPDPNGLFGLSLMQLVGIGGMCWMGIGVFIMAQMINFEI
ncbi:MAG: type II secretion system F family protein [Sphingobium sp.]|jgi:tight adherence protein B|nr:type II secretion system F family protein [Sphingobium sp.]MCI1270533.1 type II secretion system F family protein [Sphingobium sp.]MCI1755418.1 type II secretion system F family protein [Sphingobium sp.]MCI2053230.1 type II secretion system F family protein [Sphingobium sp.]